MNKREKLQEEIYTIVGAHAGISAPDIAKEVHISRVTAYTHLKELIELGIIESIGKGKSTLYRRMSPKDARILRKKKWEPTLQRFEDYILTEIIQRTQDERGEDVSVDSIRSIFDAYCMYIDPINQIYAGLHAFALWCLDEKHDFSDRVGEKAFEYFEIIGGIEYKRRKNGFFDGTPVYKSNLTGYMDIAIDRFYFHEIFALPNGFGRTRTALELAYGKSNGNERLLKQAISASIESIRLYCKSEKVDGLIYVPPTNGRNIQFRDVLEKSLQLHMPVIKAEKIRNPTKLLIAQKDIHEKEEKIRNALQSIEIFFPQDVNFSHILILDDSFTTGATPNAIAIKLRDTGYTGKITVITICGSFSYDLAITEDEI
jgi:DNA-binding Lrp family transcriptional regulator